MLSSEDKILIKTCGI